MTKQKITDAIEQCIPEIEKVTAGVVQAFEKGGRLIYLGAGTSGRLGVLDASECPPTFGVSPEMVVGIIAGGDYALRNAIEGAEDDETLAEAQLRDLNLVKEDVVIGISASGRTPYVAAGLAYANKVGCFTGAISKSPNALISQVASVGIEAITGPEVVTGSTRMKAGTAQKIIHQYDYGDCDDSSRKNLQRIYGRCSTNESKVKQRSKQYLRRLPIFSRRRKTCS